MKALLLSIMGLLAGSQARALEARPNIVFIITDQQFGDALSCRMGKQYIHTPAMDRLAEEGTFFTRAYAANPICVPSRNAMFTGRYPHELGITDNSPTGTGPAKFGSMGVYLREAGYQTGYFGKWHLCFDAHDANVNGFETHKGKATDAQIADHAIEFIQRDRSRPFLMVVSLFNPHNICEYARGDPLPNGPVGDPPPLDQLPPAPANLAPPRNEPDTMTAIRRAYHATRMTPVGDFTVKQWRELRWAYYRMIEKVDFEIGRVLHALQKAGLEERTLIVFTSDHGECAGAHGFNQKTVFYEESARVPLIVTLRGTTRKQMSDRFINTGIDVLPTILDFAGVPQPKALPGRSLRALATGRAVEDWRDHVVVQNNMVQGGMVGDLKPEAAGRMVRTERFKYCVYSHGHRRESLVDLANDPGENVDLATDPAYRTIVLAHRERLRRFGRENNDPLIEELLADEVKPRAFPRRPAANAQPAK